MNAQSYPRGNRSGQKNAGKMKSRLEAVKNLWSSPTGLDLTRNESVRLATDALLDSGPGAYGEMLSWEGELSFLSPSEIQYIVGNAEIPPQSQDRDGDGMTGQAMEVLSKSSDTYFPEKSEENGPVLEQGWPMSNKRYYLKGPSKISVYFQTGRSQRIKDLLRFYINQAAELIAIVMDVFTDIDIFCDVLEAANKRNVTVYLLLDRCSLRVFTEMCEKLQLSSCHMKNIGIRQVSGDIHCAKSGRKFSGQVQENFIIIDCVYVLAGTYSFTWLSAQVHKHFITLYSGHVVECFDEEFRRLYARSKKVKEFSSLEAVSLSRVSSHSRPLAAPIAVWPESHNTQSDPLSSPSNLSDPPSLPHPQFPLLASERYRHQGAVPQYRVLYTPVVQNRERPFLPRPAPAPRILRDDLPPPMCFKEANILWPACEEPELIPTVGNWATLLSAKHQRVVQPRASPQPGKHTLDLHFRPNNLWASKLFHNRY